MDCHAATGEKPGLVIPTGNLGNAFAAILARACGLPIGPIVLATNANATLSDWFTSGRYEARPSLATLANAMDVGAPSNFERLDGFAGGDIARVERVDDATIRDRIRATFSATWNNMYANAIPTRHPATMSEYLRPLTSLSRATCNAARRMNHPSEIGMSTFQPRFISWS